MSEQRQFVVDGIEVRPLRTYSRTPMWPGDTSWVLVFAVRGTRGWFISKAYYDDIACSVPYHVRSFGFRTMLP